MADTSALLRRLPPNDAAAAFASFTGAIGLDDPRRARLVRVAPLPGTDLVVLGTGVSATTSATVRGWCGLEKVAASADFAPGAAAVFWRVDRNRLGYVHVEGYDNDDDGLNYAALVVVA